MLCSAGAPETADHPATIIKCGVTAHFAHYARLYSTRRLT